MSSTSTIEKRSQATNAARKVALRTKPWTSDLLNCFWFYVWRPAHVRQPGQQLSRPAQTWLRPLSLAASKWTCELADELQVKSCQVTYRSLFRVACSNQHLQAAVQYCCKACNVVQGTQGTCMWPLLCTKQSTFNVLLAAGELYRCLPPEFPPCLLQPSALASPTT